MERLASALTQAHRRVEYRGFWSRQNLMVGEDLIDYGNTALGI